MPLPFPGKCLYFYRRGSSWRTDGFPPCGGALVSTGMTEAKVAGRGAAGLVKSGTKVIANNDYEYACAA